MRIACDPAFSSGRCLVRLTHFARTDSGAATVDWVILSASLVSMSLAITIGIRAAVINSAGTLESSLTSATVSELRLGD
jgi:hypothetical protein